MKSHAIMRIMAVFCTLLCLCVLFHTKARAEEVPASAWTLENVIPKGVEIAQDPYAVVSEEGTSIIFGLNGTENLTEGQSSFNTWPQDEGDNLDEELFLQQVTGSHVTPDENSLSSDELLDGYIQQLLYGSSPSNGVSFGKRQLITGNQLTGMDALLYSQLKPCIEQTAAGTRTFTKFSIPLTSLCQVRWTVEELGLGPLIETDESGQMHYTEDAYKAMDIVSEVMKYNLSRILSALLSDCPYELYWFDKTVGIYGGGYQFAASSSYIRVVGIEEPGNLVFSFAVARDYSTGVYTPTTYTDDSGTEQTVNLLLTVDSSCIESAHIAVANAQAIISRYTNLSDLAKLRAYAEEICALASYEAAPGSFYGDPWQLVWVFDGDDSTNVVCEGYAKAFQYLCDRSTFQNDISCYTVTGKIGSAGHMWNIVRMEDGLNYLVDLTNADGGSVMTGDLFLSGSQGGSVEEGYVVGHVHFFYTYSSSTRNIYTVEQLTLAPYDYGKAEPQPHSEHAPGAPTKENIVSPTCSKEGSYDEVVCCSICGAELSRKTVTLPKKEHVSDEAFRENYVEATYTEEGSYDEVICCSVCGLELSRNLVIIPKKKLPAPEIIDVTEVSGGLRIRWFSVNDATGYLIYRRIAGTKTWILLSESANLYYTDLTGKGGTYYEYAVVAKMNHVVTSDYSEVVSGCFPLNPDSSPSQEENDYYQKYSPCTGDRINPRLWLIVLFSAATAQCCVIRLGMLCLSHRKNSG